ncbi:patatin-like phospholipase family protein [Shewanella inventionis]|uniref:patatin-like phospholipase family protein n=1 Tax=Shewanella inventionis TaxID=1738770 RepID=UPI001CBF57F8|nr:patatin-like phospholipase family protein [Shewanella inventionis]UAL44481.1 patatin-like phospholipase family protein [Shewanella inventionis]
MSFNMFNTIVLAIVTVFLMACASPNVYNDLNATSPNIHTQHKLGIAFGGGGVRGFMHLGVIKALEEEGIKPDVVSGTSAGSIAAILYASGMSNNAMQAAIEDIEMSDIADFVLSSKGLVNGKRLSDWVNAQVDYDNLADMPMPVAVTATNMTTHKTVIIRSGDPGHAAQTSSTIPGVFIPVEHQGDILIDGGVFSVVPVYAAKTLGAKRVIAVDIYCHNQTQGQSETSATQLTLAVFRMQSCRLSKQEIKSADIIIAPTYEPNGSAAFDDKAAAIHAGYTATKAVIPQIKALLLN